MKKGTRICAAGLLALTMALGAAPALGVVSPATALAEDLVIEVPGQTIKVGKQEAVLLHNGKTKSYTIPAGTGIDTVMSDAKAGDTVYLGEGTYTWGSNTSKPVNIKGAGAGLTTIKGSLYYGYRSSISTSAAGANTISVSDLTVSCDTTLTTDGVGLYIGQAKHDLTVDVSNVEFKSFKNAVVVEDVKNDKTTVNLDNVKTDGVWCAVSLHEGTNALGDVTLADGSNCVYAVDVIDEKDVNTYYTTVADWRAGENGVQVTYDASGNPTVVTDDKADKDDFEAPSWPTWAGPYYTVATNEGINYTSLNKATYYADEGETVSVVADATYDAKSPYNVIDDNDVTLEGNGHTILFDSTLDVQGNNFTAQNVTLAAQGAPAINFTGNRGQGYIYTSTLKDVEINNAGFNAAVINLDGGSLDVEGDLVVVPNMAQGATAGIVVWGSGSVDFAADATVSFKDVSVKNLPFAMLMADAKGVTGKVTSANGAIVLDTEDVDANKDGVFGGTVKGVTDYTAVSAAMKAPEAQDVAMTRLYNPYTGEHFYTGDANEAQVLVTMGWNDEGQAWVAPAESETPVYRLYNPYTDEHHYTTDENEYSELAKIGWKQEGVKFYSADESGTAVYRLFNPYATRYTHIYTTDGNEAAELQEQGWSYEGVGFYGVK